MSNVNITHSGNSKDQLGDLNQKLITSINTLDGSTLGDNLITSHQVDYMSTELIPAEAVENNQEHLVLNPKLKENYWYFSFLFIGIFYENINQEHHLLSGCT